MIPVWSHFCFKCHFLKYPQQQLCWNKFWWLARTRCHRLTDPCRYTRNVDPMVNPDIPVKPDRLSGLSDRALHVPTQRHSTCSFICGTSPELVHYWKSWKIFGCIRKKSLRRNKQSRNIWLSATIRMRYGCLGLRRWVSLRWKNLRQYFWWKNLYFLWTHAGRESINVYSNCFPPIFSCTLSV